VLLLCGETNEIGVASSERKEEPAKCISTVLKSTTVLRLCVRWKW